MNTKRQIALKVCGMRDAQNIKELTRLKPQYVGFIFYDKSKRFVGEDFDEQVMGVLSKTIKKTGVFVNADPSYIKEKVNRYQLDAVQLHGDETPEYCHQIKEFGVQIINVFSVGESFDFEVVLPFGECSDFYLFDTKGKERGGNGVSFNWKILNNYKQEKPFFLSGGIGPESIELITNFNHPKCVAIDINSQFETSPGLKDINTIWAFKRTLEHKKILI